ncbi:peptidylprolyl isomerase [Paenibacillus eucommiae]|uniref:peptidylprolyl isomerase n=1 Tax=Paenibacillus eucommiae TaxID=1355755 RepID=A0ABS4INK9_9BACL|nr:peptidyl-prolyl cis-trans isomerase [Paenibacillus eucommiae]MBP1989153.1 foldase protein PrsA [Paenibacillus eucommiae]
MSKSVQGRLWVYISVVLAAILIVYIVVYPPGKQAKADSISVATVNGVNISKDKLYDALYEAGGQQTMEKLIANELVRQAAEKEGIAVTDADLEKELDGIRKDYATDEEFQSTLAMYGMTVEGLKKDMVIQAQLRKILEPQVTITDEDITAYYNEKKDTFIIPEQVKTSHILVATKEEAEAVLAGLKNGDDFAAKAKEKSTDAATKDSGGELELFAKGDKEAAIETAVFGLKVGELSGVVQATDGFHIYKLTDRKDAITPALEEKKEEIRASLTTEKISALSQTWMEEQQSKATIVNLLEG